MAKKAGATKAEAQQALFMCGLAYEGSLRQARDEVACLAGKAYHAAVRAKLDLPTSYKLEERFSPPGTFDGAQGRPHWWDRLAAKGRPNLLNWKSKGDYDRIAEIAKCTDVPEEIRTWTLWRLLDPTPLRPDELYTCMLTPGRHLRNLAPVEAFVEADPFHVGLTVGRSSELPIVFGRLLVSIFALRRAESRGDCYAYRDALTKWMDVRRHLQKDCHIESWLPDLDSHLNRWFCRVRMLIKYPDGAVVNEVAVFEEKDGRIGARVIKPYKASTKTLAAKRALPKSAGSKGVSARLASRERRRKPSKR